MQTNEPVWLKYMPDHVYLYWVDYNSDLNDDLELIQKCIDGNDLYPIEEDIWMNWESGVNEYLEEVRKKMCAEGLLEAYDECKDEIRDWLYTHDDSNPAADLIRNTGDVTFFYSFGLNIPGWQYGFTKPYRAETEAQSINRIRRKLGIKKGTSDDEAIARVVANASYGGELRIYFEDDINSMVSSDQDFKSIIFDGEFAVAVYNANEGSGDFEFINIRCSVPFLRENLYVSGIEKYNLERCFGMCGDWLRKGDVPITSLQKSKRSINKSSTAADLKREAQYKATFKAGSCTFGDMDISRHRNVYYKNEYPCGMHCPHCGTFWID